MISNAHTGDIDAAEYEYDAEYSHYMSGGEYRARGSRKKKILTREEARKRREDRNAARTHEDWQRYAKDIVYRQLAMRDRCTHELREALRKRDVPDDIAATVIQAFIQAGLVDDATFAMAFVRNRFREKTMARRMLAQELRCRGLAPEVCEPALAQISAEDEKQSAVNFARHKVRSMHGLDVQVIRRRIYAALARRGFSASDSRFAIEKALAHVYTDMCEMDDEC